MIFLESQTRWKHANNWLHFAMKILLVKFYWNCHFFLFLFFVLSILKRHIIVVQVIELPPHDFFSYRSNTMLLMTCLLLLPFPLFVRYFAASILLRLRLLSFIITIISHTKVTKLNNFFTRFYLSYKHESF